MRDPRCPRSSKVPSRSKNASKRFNIGDELYFLDLTQAKEETGVRRYSQKHGKRCRFANDSRGGVVRRLHSQPVVSVMAICHQLTIPAHHDETVVSVQSPTLVARGEVHYFESGFVIELNTQIGR